jgi:hypothetical protein
MNTSGVPSRRDFLKKSTMYLAGMLLPLKFANQALAGALAPFTPKISGHIWVYANAFPPQLGCDSRSGESL